MYKRLTTYYLAIFSVLFTLCVLFPLATSAETISQKSISYHIQDFKMEATESGLSINISGNSAPAFTTRTLYNPTRYVLDIANVTLNNKLQIDNLIPENEIIKLQTSVLKDQTPSITRFEFFLKGDYQQNVERKDNDILVQFSSPESSNAVVDNKTVLIDDLLVETTPTETRLLFVADNPISDFRYDVTEGNGKLPPRMFIDINNVDATKLVREKFIGTSLENVRVATRGSGIRIVFESKTPEIFEYSIESVSQGLSVKVKEPSQSPKAPAQTSKKSDATLEELIDSSEAAARIKKGEKFDESFEVSDATASLQDKFQFSGYTKKRISVDFYKIDLHNVFRLFRQVSDLNLIVDESVHGTLTLALNDVPWDFALDIILNLTNLQKEERFNTMVIYPKTKGFVWPDRSEDNLSFEADIEIVEQEALIIQQAEDQPKEIMLAKEFQRKAKIEQKKGNFENATDLYLKAFELWPSNNKLSNKLAALYLVDLKINSKAVFHAKKSLEIKPDDTEAALTAAIGLANMEKIPEAAEYFIQSISDSPPRKEALLSYAAFNENNDKPTAAIKILDKFHTHYGENVDTMVAKARIYDKLALTEKANTQYKLIYNSGFPIRPDLRRYIESRIAVRQ